MQQLSLPLSDTVAPSLDLEALRERLAAAPSPARAFRLLYPWREKSLLPALAREAGVLAALAARQVEQAEDGPERRRLCWLAGELYWNADDLVRAAAAYQRALAGSGPRNPRFDLACLRRRALCLARLGFATEAERDYAALRVIADRVLTPKHRADFEFEMAEIQSSDYQLSALALESYTLAACCYRALEHPHRLAECELYRGLMLQLIGRWEESVQPIRVARRLFVRLEDDEQTTEADEQLEDAFRILEQPRRLLGAASRAFASYHRSCDLLWMTKAQRDRAHAFHLLGRREERDEAFILAVQLQESSNSDWSRKQATSWRLQHAVMLAEDQRFGWVMSIAETAIPSLKSIADFAPDFLVDVFGAIGRAREALESQARGPLFQVPRRPLDCPPSAGARFLRPLDPRLLLYLSRSLGTN